MVSNARWAGWWLVTALLVQGCTKSAPSRTYVVRDSAGVTIVENTSPAWSSGEEWRVVEPPVVEIGVIDGDQRYQLSRVLGVGRLSDGRILVANGGSQEIRVIRASLSPVAVTRSDVDMYWDRIISRIPRERDNARREARRQIAKFPVAKTFPPYRGLEVDVLGNIWVVQYTWPSDAVPRYTVFSPQGTMLGEVVLPPGIERQGVPLYDPPLDIGTDYVLGI